MLTKIQNLSVTKRKAISIIFFSVLCAAELALIALAEYLVWKISDKHIVELIMMSGFTFPIFFGIPVYCLWERINIVRRCTDKV